MILLPDDERKRLLGEISVEYKNIFRQNLDATGAGAHMSAPHSRAATSPIVKIGRWIMKMTVEQLDKLRTSRRKVPQRSLTLVSPIAPPAPSPPASLSRLQPRPFVPPAPIDADYLDIPASAPAPAAWLNIGMYLGSAALCAIAGWYSVQGLVEFFSFSPVESYVMGGTMELVKFLGVSWIAYNWSFIRWYWRWSVAAMLVTMAAITFIGNYVHLTQSHVGNRPEIVAKLQRELADVERKIVAKSATEAGNKQTADITTKAVEKLIQQGQPKAALKALEKKSAPTQSASAEPSLDAQADELRTKLALLTETGKVQFLAKLSTLNPDTIVAWFILIITLMLDPLGLALNAAVASRRR